MKVSFVLIAFNAAHVLEPCLLSVLPFGQVYAAEGPVRFWQERGFTTSTDKTNDILLRYGIPTRHGCWNEKDDEANAALGLVARDSDFIFCLDADEIWKAETLTRIFETLSEGKTDSMSFHATSFYGGFDRYMTGFEENFEVHRVQRYRSGAQFSTHRPPTILAPDGRPWRNHRHVKSAERFYHYSYVFPSQMKAKSEYYAAMGGNIPNYFEKVYRPWVTGTEIERFNIENQYDGVHNWLPRRRGPCRTARFDGQHPDAIQEAMPRLLERFKSEMIDL